MTRTEQIQEQIQYVKYIQRQTEDVEFRKAYDSTIDNLEILIAEIDPDDEDTEIQSDEDYMIEITNDRIDLENSQR